MKSETQNHSHKPTSVLNAVGKIDPTKTLSLRNRMVKDVTRRFKALKRDIITSIVDRDAFGLKDDGPRVPGMMEAAKELEFAFKTSAEKAESFMKWLREQQAKGILEIIQKPGLISATGQPWTNLYIKSAYEKGVLSADAKLAKAGVDIVSVQGPGARLAGVFSQPAHADRAGVLFTRVFSDLEGITEAMDASISRVLAEGLILGGSPDQLAKEIVSKVDGIGLNRARTLARTEIVRANHLGSIQEYRNAGLNEVNVQAEYIVADDPCPICEPYDGKILSLDEAETLIPQHPSCRCSTSPWVAGIS